MKYKVSELEGWMLDWAVAKVQQVQYVAEVSRSMICKRGEEYKDGGPYRYTMYRPSSKWRDGCPIIESESICVAKLGLETWHAFHPDAHGDVGSFSLNALEYRCYLDVHGYDATGSGPTFLIAAMRALVTVKAGEEVELP